MKEGNGYDFYEHHCKQRFDEHGEKIDELMIIVKNGLSNRMKRIDRTQWAILSLVGAAVVKVMFF